MAGSSDGGAHLLSFCGADFTTRLITDWTPDVLPIEEAIARLTSIPARAYGIADRGTLEAGKAADVLLVDRERLSAGETPRYVRDFPAASDRYVVDATGYNSVIVNGETLPRDGADTGRAPASCSDTGDRRELTSRRSNRTCVSVCVAATRRSPIRCPAWVPSTCG